MTPDSFDPQFKDSTDDDGVATIETTDDDTSAEIFVDGFERGHVFGRRRRVWGQAKLGLPWMAKRLWMRSWINASQQIGRYHRNQPALPRALQNWLPSQQKTPDP